MLLIKLRARGSLNRHDIAAIMFSFLKKVPRNHNARVDGNGDSGKHRYELLVAKVVVVAFITVSIFIWL